MARVGSTKTARAREMRSMLARLAQSGLTQREFARQEGVPPSTITWWSYVFRHAAEQAVKGRRRPRRPARKMHRAGSAFVEVKMDAAVRPQVATVEIVVRTGR